VKVEEAESVLWPAYYSRTVVNTVATPVPPITVDLDGENAKSGTVATIAISEISFSCMRLSLSRSIMHLFEEKSG
jgi:hypothetical protein